ncbi:MAG TPA: hypothetical protein VF952_13605 [Chloroflexia bacterium]|jgi:hypothetical protein
MTSDFRPGKQSGDPSRRLRPLVTHSSSYSDIRLDFTPEAPPEPEARRSSLVLHYPLELGFIHIYLDDVDAAEQAPSAPLYLLLSRLAAGISNLVDSQDITGDWESDPWQIDIRGEAKRNRVYITLQSPPNNWIAMREVEVPLDRFAEEVLQVTKRWLEYLNSIYHDEIADVDKGRFYRNMEQILKQQQQVLRDYRAR